MSDPRKARIRKYRVALAAARMRGEASGDRTEVARTAVELADAEQAEIRAQSTWVGTEWGVLRPEPFMGVIACATKGEAERTAAQIESGHEGRWLVVSRERYVRAWVALDAD